MFVVLPEHINFVRDVVVDLQLLLARILLRAVFGGGVVAAASAVCGATAFASLVAV